MKTSHCIVERVDFDVSMCASPDFCIRDDISEFPRREYVCGAFTLRPYLVVNIIKITEWGQHIFQSTLIYQFLHENYKHIVYINCFECQNKNTIYVHNMF